MDPNGFAFTRMMKKGAFCSDCTVLGGKMIVVFDNGTRADIGGGVYLHHSIALDTSKRLSGFITSCPPKGNYAINDLPKKGIGMSTIIGGAVVSSSKEIQSLNALILSAG
jgi:hypothetical protein